MVLAMLKRRKNQPKTEPKTKPPQPPPSSPPLSSPNALSSLPNFSQNGSIASPNPQDSASLSIPTTASTNDSDDEIARFAKQSGIPESIVRIEFRIIQSLYNATHKDIVNRYYTLSMHDLLPILKLRYIRCFWKQLSQNSESDFPKQSKNNANDAE
jgi:hypothetical protein